MKILIVEDGPGVRDISLSGRDYAEKFQDLVSRKYWWSDFYLQGFQDLGCEATQIYPENPDLAACYCNEFGEGIFRMGAELVCYEIKRFDPEIVLLHSDSIITNLSAIKEIRNCLPSGAILTGYYGTVSPKFDPAKSGLDLLFVPCKWMVQKYREAGLASTQIRHAVNIPSSEKSFKTGEGERDLFSFVGNVYDVSELWKYSYEVLKAVLPTTSLEVWGKISRPWRSSLSAELCFRSNQVLRKLGISTNWRKGIPWLRWGSSWTESPNQARFGLRHYKDRVHAPAYGDVLDKILRRSLVTLNVHADIARGESVNFRLFESVREGACLLTNHTSDLAEVYDDDEVVSFRGPTEAIEKANFLMSRPDVARDYAKRARDRARRSHTFRSRVEEMFDVMAQLKFGSLKRSTKTPSISRFK